MIRLILVAVFLIFLQLLYVPGFSQNLNISRTWIAERPIALEADIISTSRTVQEVKQGTQYLDGFGRMVQTVSKQISPLQKDAVNMHVYDSWGRELQQFLPFANGTDGELKASPQTLQTTFNQGLYPGEANFYSQITLENSPINRLQNAYAPGSSWAGASRGTNVQLLVNTSSDNVRIWNIALAVGSIPATSATYAAGQLFKTIGKDEKNLQIIEYKDKNGLVILKKTQYTATADNGSGSSHVGWLCTYYVYDDYSRLRFVIPPRLIQIIDGTWSISQTNADEFCLRMEYDDLDRVNIKKNAGANEQWFVYDQVGHLVMTQDGNLRNDKKWQYYKFDDVNRPASTGLIYDPTNYNNLNFHKGAAVGVNGYPNIASYTTELISQTYYDNYSWVSGTGSGLGTSLDQTYTSNPTYFSSSSNTTFPYPQSVVQSSMNRGFATGSKTEVLGSNGVDYLYTVSFYDDKGRVIQTQGTNVSGAIDKSTRQYSWSGEPLRVLEQHKKNGSVNHNHTVLTKMNYDHADRLLSLTKTVSSTIGTTNFNTPEKVIATYTYNEAGQLKTKGLGTHPVLGTPIETLNYDYNVRGWITGINKVFTQAGNNANYFGLELGYDKTTSSNGAAFTPTYNGNVSGQIWKTKGDAIPRKYDYTYDNLNQLTIAGYLQNTGGSTWDKTTMDYSVNNISYDYNGNITALNQNGFVLGGTPNIDNLTYNYLNSNYSNRLMNVIDGSNNALSKLGDFHYTGTKTSSSVDYTYDFNGNRKSDANKGITAITYNLLNLPSVITTAKGTITYTYDASGNKIKKIVQENNASVPYGGTNYSANITTTTTYIGGFIYQSKIYNLSILAPLNVAENIQMFAHEEGRARIITQASGTQVFAFDYFIRDHLGNMRMVLTDEQVQDTYPAATLEPGGIASELAYYNFKNNPSFLIPTSTLTWYSGASGSTYANNNGVPSPPDPTVNRTGTSANLYKLNGNSGDRFGLGIVLKVMAGDAISIYGRSIWHSNGQPLNNTSYNLSNVLVSFIDAFAGTSAVIGGSKGIATSSVLNGSSAVTGPLSTWLNNVPTPGAGGGPKAYINWILFDEQFKQVGAGSSYDPISATADVVKPHSRTGITMPKSGYVYIYCSNESNQDVYFDNLQVVHNRGQLIEERHFYPQGLTMAGLTSRAMGKLQNNFGYQGKELQSGEFYDGTGLDEYDFEARYYDPQLGRWHSQDPEGQFASPYTGMGNNWVIGVDPNGEWVHIVIGAAIGGIVNLGVKAFQGKIHNWGDGFKAFGVGALAGGLGAATGGAALSLTGLAGASVAGGAVSGVAGSAIASPVLGGGNNLFFGDPYSAKDYGKDLLIGGVGGAVIGGFTAGYKGNNIWLGDEVAPGRSIFSFNNSPTGSRVTVGQIEYAGWEVDEGVISKEFAGHRVGQLQSGGQEFDSFNDFKRAFGPAGKNMAWHHIVEQNPSNITKFGNRAVHNTENLIKLPHGKGSIHAKVSGYYSSKMPGTNMLVRDYVKTLSFQEQFDFGIAVLRRFGWTP